MLSSEGNEEGCLFLEVSGIISTMPFRKTKEQREAEHAELDRLDREHSARLAALNEAARPIPPLFCQPCGAALEPIAVRCHYCGSEDLALSQPPIPLFSEAVINGACPRCHGMSFSKQTSTGRFATRGLVLGGPAGAVVGAAIGAAMPSDFVSCDACGATFRRD